MDNRVILFSLSGNEALQFLGDDALMAATISIRQAPPFPGPGGMVICGGMVK